MRTYKRKTNRGTTSIEVYKEAAKLVTEGGKSVRSAAKSLELCHMTLSRYIKNNKNVTNPVVGYKATRQVFNEEQEKKLTDYLLKCATIYHGLLPSEVRKVAYDCAVKFNINNIPKSWKDHGMAGPDWLSSFMKRNPQLSIRTPEATSLSRATSFNKKNVGDFFSKLGEILLKHDIPASRIWNVDETGVTTVQKPNKIVAQKGIKQVRAVTSGERGTLVTVEMTVSAAGNTLPPMFVFPRLKYKELFVQNGPPECIGAGNKSGWMTTTEFLLYMEHFIKFVKPTPSEPVLLLLDNHGSHIDIEVVDKAKDNSVIMLSFPPHCSHRLQPLDVGVYGPFKHYCATAQDNWMRNNPGKTMSIYEIPAIVKYAWPLASTPVNIRNSFQKTGICPFNPNIFQDSDYAPSYVTDRIRADCENQETSVSVGVPGEKENVPPPSTQNPSEVEAGLSHLNETNLPEPLNGNDAAAGFSDDNSGNTPRFTPEAVRPLPKAPPRKSVASKRKVKKSAVLTDTPEKNALAEEQAAKKRRSVVKKGSEKKTGKGKIKSKAKSTVRKVLQTVASDQSEEDDIEYYCLVCSKPYSKSTSCGDWIQCLVCKRWAHERCIENNHRISFVCFNRYSSESSESS